MSKIEQQLIESLKIELPKILGHDVAEKQISLQKTRKEFEGDFTLIVFPFTKILKAGPEQSGELIGHHLLNAVDEITSYNVVKGFLNLVLDSSVWLKRFEEIQQEEQFGFLPPKSKGRRMVEYSSPNTNKPLHLGHLRNNFLGYSVSQILEANGHEVIKVQIINDRGIHICKSMLAWQEFGNGETPENSEIKGDHLVGKYYVLFDKKYKDEVKELIEKGTGEEEAKKNAPILLRAQKMLKLWEEGDHSVRELWQRMNQWVYDGFSETYSNMGVDFNKLYYESDTYILGKQMVEKHLKDEHFFSKEDGSVWINLETEKLDHKLLLRSDGTSVYITQDIGTAIVRHEEFNCDKYYYIVGNEQDYHFKVLSIILKKMGYEWAEGIEHVSYGMVDLPSGKMKSREGTVVDADDLMLEMKSTAASISEELGKTQGLTEKEKEQLFHTIGLGALKYFILKVDPKKRMLFDPKESVDFNGNTGPFIQYTHARICSILRKNALDENAASPDVNKLSDLDFGMIKIWNDFPQVVHDAGEQLSPALIANYIYDLVKAFNHYYQNSDSISQEEDESVKQFRLKLCRKTGLIIKQGMGLLGIHVPERM